MDFFGKDVQEYKQINPYADWQQQGLRDAYGQVSGQKEKTANDYNTSSLGNEFENIMQNARTTAQNNYNTNAQAIAQKYKQPGSYGMQANYQNSGQLANDLFGAESNARLQKAQYMDAYNRQGQQMADAYNQNRMATLLNMVNAQPQDTQINQKHQAGFMDYFTPIANIAAKAGDLALMAYGLPPVASTATDAALNAAKPSVPASSRPGYQGRM